MVDSLFVLLGLSDSRLLLAALVAHVIFHNKQRHCNVIFTKRITCTPVMPRLHFTGRFLQTHGNAQSLIHFHHIQARLFMNDKLTPEQLAKITPIPYSDEQEDNDYAQLSHEQLEQINRENSGNIVESLVSDVVTPDKDKPQIPPLPQDD